MVHGILGCPSTYGRVLPTVDNKYFLRSPNLRITASHSSESQWRAAEKLTADVNRNTPRWSEECSLCSSAMNGTSTGLSSCCIKICPANGCSHHQELSPWYMSTPVYIYVFCASTNHSASRICAGDAAGLESTVNKMMNDIREMKIA